VITDFEMQLWEVSVICSLRWGLNDLPVWPMYDFHNRSRGFGKLLGKHWV
jgi:hypothetical protein